MPQYFDQAPPAPSRRRELTLDVAPLHAPMHVVTDRAVFSGERLDHGTRVLLEQSPMPTDASGDLLDMGCGWGPIALVLAAAAPNATVWAIDVNERARALCVENAAANNLANVRVVAPENVPKSVSFAGMWSNPPIRIGKVALWELLQHWLVRLSPDARAWLVVHKHLGADPLADRLSGAGFATKRLRSKQGFRVLEVGGHRSTEAGGVASSS